MTRSIAIQVILIVTLSVIGLIHLGNQTANASSAETMAPHVVKRLIDSNGSPEIHYSDGCIRKIKGDQVILVCGERTEGGSPSTAVFPNPPQAPALLEWGKKLNSRLLFTINNLLERDEESLENYKSSEKDQSLTEQIERRSRMIAFLSSPRYTR